MKEQGYLNKQVSEITGMNPQTIAYYSNHGIVLPSIDKGKGRGSNRLYSRQDILKFLLIKELSSHGLSLERIKIVFSDLERMSDFGSIFDGLMDIADPALAWSSQPSRLFLILSSTGSENIKAGIVSVDMNEYYGMPQELLEDKIDLKKFPVNIADHKSVLILDITELCQKASKG